MTKISKNIPSKFIIINKKILRDRIMSKIKVKIKHKNRNHFNREYMLIKSHNTYITKMILKKKVLFTR